MATARLTCPDYAGWICKPIGDITGRIERISCGSVLVLAWPDEDRRPLPARLLYVKPEWVDWDG